MSSASARSPRTRVQAATTEPLSRSTRRRNASRSPASTASTTRRSSNGAVASAVVAQVRSVDPSSRAGLGRVPAGAPDGAGSAPDRMIDHRAGSHRRTEVIDPDDLRTRVLSRRPTRLGRSRCPGRRPGRRCRCHSGRRHRAGRCRRPRSRPGRSDRPGRSVALVVGAVLWESVLFGPWLSGLGVAAWW